MTRLEQRLTNAIWDFIHGLDHGCIVVDMPDSAFVRGLRDALALATAAEDAERERGAA